jgi:hypothetical protein
MYAAHDLPNSHKNLRNVLPVAVDIVVVYPLAPPHLT